MTRSLSLALYLAARSGRKPWPDKDRVPPRPDGPLIWFHTGQDRLALATRELAKRLRTEREDLTFLLTNDSEHVDKTGPCVISCPVPDETLATIRGFLDHWRPDIAIWTEPDLRPALIAEVGERDIPMMLVDARTAPLDPKTWRWRRGMYGALLSRFDHILTGDPDAAGTLRRLGIPPQTLELTGYLEEGTAALTYNEADRNALASGLGGRPVWLAMRLSQPERDVVIAAHRQAQRRAHRLLLILVPDDPDRGADWAGELAAAGYRVALRSAGEEPEAETQIYVADTIGEAGLLYRLAPIAFLGQSLDTEGGVNPFEAAALGSAVLHGPNIRNFRHAYARLTTAGAARLVRDAQELGDAVEALLSPDVAATMAHEAWRVCSSGAEVTDRVTDLILTALDARDSA